MRTFFMMVVSCLSFSGLSSQTNRPLNPRIDSILPPIPTTYLTDMAKVVKNPDEVNRVLQFARDSQKLSLVAVTMSTIGRFDVADVALEMGRKWKVATANDTIGATIRNTGGVILLVMDTHKCRVEVATGSEGYITDSRAAELCRGAAHLFKSGDFGGGIISIAKGFEKYHTQEVIATSKPVSTQPKLPTNWGVVLSWIICVGGLLTIVIVVLVKRFKKIAEIREAKEREIRAVQEEQERKANIALRERDLILVAAEAKRWNALTPAQQAAELNEKARLKRITEERRKKQEQERKEQEREELKIYYLTSYNDDSEDSSGSSGGSTDWSSGGSDSFGGDGGGESSW